MIPVYIPREAGRLAYTWLKESSFSFTLGAGTGNCMLFEVEDSGVAVELALRFS